MDNRMKTFLNRILKFSSIFLLITVILILFFKAISDLNTDYSSLIEKNDFSVLILGDSQPETALNDSIIENSINFSNSGDPVFFYYVKLKKLLEIGVSPDIVILGFSPINLYSKDFYKVSRMKTKLKKYFFMMDIKDLEDITLHNWKAAYQGLVSTIFYSPRSKNFWSQQDIMNLGVGGYKELPIEKGAPRTKNFAEKRNSTGLEPDQISLEYLEEIIKLCQRNGLKLVLLNTPVHESFQIIKVEQREDYKKFLQTLNDNIEVWDYDNFEMDDCNFYDQNHLNKEGAIIFSLFINSKLKEMKQSN